MNQNTDPSSSGQPQDLAQAVIFANWLRISQQIPFVFGGLNFMNLTPNFPPQESQLAPIQTPDVPLDLTKDTSLAPSPLSNTSSQPTSDSDAELPTVGSFLSKTNKLSVPWKPKRVRTARDPNRIKRPMNAFMLFAKEERKKVGKADPELLHTDILKIVGSKWRGMSEAEKEPFFDEQDRVRKLHMEEHPDYKYKPIRRHKKKHTGESGSGKCKIESVEDKLLTKKGKQDKALKIKSKADFNMPANQPTAPTPPFDWSPYLPQLELLLNEK